MLPQRSQTALPRRTTGFQTLTLAGGTESASRHSSLAPLVPWLTPLWITGVSLIYLRRVAGGIAVQGLRRRGICSAPEHWQMRLNQLGAQLRVSRPIQLLESALAEAPAVLGHFRPLILVPAGLLAGLPPAQMEAILLHELAHIRRHDYLLNVLQRLAEGLFFYHPCIWWISRVMRVERENCCDDLALSISGDAHEYAGALAALEQHRQAVAEPAVAATGGNMVKRIRRVLYPAKSNTPWVSFLAAALLILAAAAALAARPPQSLEPGSPDVQSQKPGEAAKKLNRYSKWLNEDVVYIINDDEKAAFLALPTDEERDNFIERFWEKRNPSPGAAENEFKEEHYRRIAYANEHFQTTIPGWRTPRGQLYIVYGPPDNIESHPEGTPRVYGSGPAEVWTYNHLPPDGESVSFTVASLKSGGEVVLTPGTRSYLRNPVSLPTPSVVGRVAAASPSEGAPDSRRETSHDAAPVQRIRISAGVADGMVVEKVPPVYPEIAQQARIQGDVVLRAVIGPDGAVQNLQLVSGHPVLAPAAMEAVRQWRYQPYLLNGSPVEVETVVSIPFSLGASDAALGPSDAAPVQRIRISEGVADSMVVEKVPPVYPEMAQQARIQGEVLLRVVIGPDGSVKELHVISGQPMLVPAAMEAVRQWRYKPFFLDDGSPVAVEAPVRIPFKLGS
jgi:TonB family protein